MTTQKEEKSNIKISINVGLIHFIDITLASKPKSPPNFGFDTKRNSTNVENLLYPLLHVKSKTTRLLECIYGWTDCGRAVRTM